MNSICLHSELDLGHTENYTPFTLLGVTLVIGVILIFSAVTFKNFASWIAPAYFIFLFVTLAYDIVMLNKVIPSGHVIFQKRFNDLEVELRIDRNTLISGQIVDFSYGWTGQNIFLDLIYESGQNVTLYETLMPWENIPQNWQYKMKIFSADTMSYPTFKVKEMVDLLLREFKA